MDERTIRELGGEIAAEISYGLCTPEHPLAQMDWRHKQAIVDVVMGVLARHAGKKMVNDEDIPVAPLPKKTFE